MKRVSDFGKGFIYPLSLYAMHLGSISLSQSYIEFWTAVDGAYDHLYELNIPKDLPKNIVKDINYLLNRLRKYKRNSCRASILKPAPKDKLRIINQSKKIFFDIDKYYLKVNPIRGEYE